MADRATLVDNNTWNNTHIALVGKAMASNETEAYRIMKGKLFHRFFVYDLLNLKIFHGNGAMFYIYI